MTEIDYTDKLAKLDRMLNDPDVAMEPSLVWALLDEVSRHVDVAEGAGKEGELF